MSCLCAGERSLQGRFSSCIRKLMVVSKPCSLGTGLNPPSSLLAASRGRPWRSRGPAWLSQVENPPPIPQAQPRAAPSRGCGGHRGWSLPRRNRSHLGRRTESTAGLERRCHCPQVSPLSPRWRTPKPEQHCCDRTPSWRRSAKTIEGRWRGQATALRSRWKGDESHGQRGCGPAGRAGGSEGAEALGWRGLQEPPLQ